MSKILISPAHYVLAKNSRSEFANSANLIYDIARMNPNNQYTAVCGKCFDLSEIPHNLKIVEVLDEKSHLDLGIGTRIKFYIKYPWVTFQLLRRNKFSKIWHHLPSGWYSLNPVILLNIDRFYNPGIERIIGALQHRRNNHDYSIVENAELYSTGSKNIPFKRIDKLIYRFLLYFIGIFSKMYFHKFDVLIYDTKQAIEFYRQKMGGFNGEQIVTYIPLGIDTERFYSKKKVYSSPYTFVFAGNLIPRKRVDILLRLCRILQKRKMKFKLHIYGDGEVRANLQELTRDLSLDSYVIFHGVKENKQMPTILQKAHLLFLLSTHESFGLVVPEAWASRTLFVGSNIETFGDKVVDNVNAIILDIDKQSLNACANRIFSLSNTEFERITEQALSDVKEYDNRIVTSQYANLL